MEIDGAYLAGLIEGDGCIYVPKNKINTQNRRTYPLISITFHRNELTFFERLLESIGTGFIYLRKDSKGGDLRIGTVEGVIKVINIINGYMRTPKIESLHAAIDFINDQRGLKIKKMALDKSSIKSNAWLSGFIEADGCFMVIIRTKGYKKGRVVCLFLIAQRKVDKSGGSMIEILREIAGLLGKETVGETKDGKYYVQSNSMETNRRLESYLNKYNLKSGKYRDYSSWREVLNMMDGKEHLTDKGRDRVKEIIESMYGR